MWLYLNQFVHNQICKCIKSADTAATTHQDYNYILSGWPPTQSLSIQQSTVLHIYIYIHTFKATLSKNVVFFATWRLYMF